jgi:hypothetical protein
MKDIVKWQKVETQVSFLRLILDTAFTVENNSNELTGATDSIHIRHSSSLSLAILNFYCKFSNSTFKNVSICFFILLVLTLR